MWSTQDGWACWLLQLHSPGAQNACTCPGTSLLCGCMLKLYSQNSCSGLSMEQPGGGKGKEYEVQDLGRHAGCCMWVLGACTFESALIL